jgi:hypothetical protein
MVSRSRLVEAAVPLGAPRSPSALREALTGLRFEPLGARALALPRRETPAWLDATCHEAEARVPGAGAAALAALLGDPLISFECVAPAEQRSIAVLGCVLPPRGDAVVLLARLKLRVQGGRPVDCGELTLVGANVEQSAGCANSCGTWRPS